METMSYPCSPLIPLPTHHEEGSYLLWSPQVLIPLENGNMRDGNAGPFPDHHHQQQDHELMNMLIQEANVLLLQDELSNGDPSLDGSNQRLGLQENGSLLLGVQEEFMEESSLGDLLVAGARAVESRDSISASAILSRIDAAPVSSSDHLACYFARGLRSRISGECRPIADAAAPGNRMPAYRMLQELSPFIKFAHFTANQAILEATADDPAVHVVDLNVGEGVQWASLMSDLTRHGSCKPFRLTEAFVTADAGAGAQRMAATARRLSEYAALLNVPFQYSSLHLRCDEDLHGLATSCCNGGGGSSVIVSCDTTDQSYSSLTRLQLLLAGSVVRILRPKLVITTEEELFRMGRNPGAGAGFSFAEFFQEALHHFGVVLESLASCFRDGGYGACLALVEKETLGPRIQDAVGQYQCGSVTGGACSVGLEGFSACEMSSFSVAQGRMLAGLFSRGFGVVHGEGRLALCWKSRPLTSVSVWSPV
ncbi:protein NODULATION SIGNALING PATHWAY 2-like [Miscanthus floridulus]|uniref:protein NODULATION SIGNALING PATHWAY 2-like n=1 Tax=Miscanthus floridulus TaxID=154761 RepID=UPI00345A2C37